MHGVYVGQCLCECHVSGVRVRVCDVNGEGIRVVATMLAEL